MRDSCRKACTDYNKTRTDLCITVKLFIPKEKKYKHNSHLQEAYGTDEGRFLSSLCTISMTLVLCLHGLEQNLSATYTPVKMETAWVIPNTKCQRGAVLISALPHLMSRFPQLPCALMLIPKLPWVKRQLRQLVSAAACDGLILRWRSWVSLCTVEDKVKS